MPIKYDKLLKLLEQNGYTSYRIRKEEIIGQSAEGLIDDLQGNKEMAFKRAGSKKIY